MKTCNHCGQTLPLESFYRDRAAPDGRRRTCIACQKAHKRTPEAREQNRRYNQSEKGLTAQRRYRESEKYKETDALRRQRPKYRTYLEAQREAAYHRQWQRNHYDPVKAAQQRQSAGRLRWIKSYQSRPDIQERLRDIARRSYQRRVARKRDLPATLTSAEWQRTLNHFGQACAYCGSTNGTLHQDHFVPLSRDGAYTATNIVPACIRCNSSKHDHMPEDWCSPESYVRIKAYLYT